MKYPDTPDKFMASELDLHEHLLSLYSVAASPELYPTLVELNSVTSILGMIAHENTDISLGAVGLIQEMTDPELFAEGEEENASVLVDALLTGQGLELLVQNLSRLDESSEEDAQGVYNSLAVIENLVEIRPSIAVTVCEKTNILEFLLLRLKSKAFDANKFYCAEILSVLLQADAENQRRVCCIPGLDGMDALLQVYIYIYIYIYN
jgi:beta-catenin-like protein 1